MTIGPVKSMNGYKASGLFSIDEVYGYMLRSRWPSLSYAKLVQSDSPIRYWPLESDGTEILGRSDFTFNGSPSNVADSPSGVMGGSYDFDGTNNGETAADGETWVPLGGSIAVEAWVKSAMPDTEYNITYNLFQTKRLGFHFPHGSSTVYWDYGDLGANAGRTSFAWDTAWNNQWNHVVMWANAGIMRVYVNAVKVHEESGKTNGLDNIASSKFYVNGETGGTRGKQSICHLAVYNTLTEEQIREHYLFGLWTGFTAYADYSSLIVADGATNYWKLNETSGTTATDSIGSGNGTYINAPTLGATGLVPGDTAVTFNGIDEYVNIGDLAPADFGTSDFTIEAWVKTTSSAAQAIAQKYWGTVTDSGWIFAMQPSGEIYLDGRHKSGGYWSGPRSVAIVNDGASHHVVVVRSSGTITLYVDGVPDSSLAGFTGDVANARNMSIGSFDGVQSPFDGTIDEVAIYGVALSAQQIKNHYLQGKS